MIQEKQFFSHFFAPLIPNTNVGCDDDLLQSAHPPNDLLLIKSHYLTKQHVAKKAEKKLKKAQ